MYKICKREVQKEKERTSLSTIQSGVLPHNDNAVKYRDTLPKKG